MKPPKYYLGFLFEPDMRDDLHCTHCYFGTLNQANLARVIEEVDIFFRYFGPITLSQPLFNQPELFGPDKSISVLLASDPRVFLPMQSVRNVLGGIGLLNTEYPFKPHVTTHMLVVSKPIVAYALVKSGEIMKRWPINGGVKP